MAIDKALTVIRHLLPKWHEILINAVEDYIEFASPNWEYRVVYSGKPWKLEGVFDQSAGWYLINRSSKILAKEKSLQKLISVMETVAVIES